MVVIYVWWERFSGNIKCFLQTSTEEFKLCDTTLEVLELVAPRDIGPL
jgi:hypothetical protein